MNDPLAVEVPAVPSVPSRRVRVLVVENDNALHGLQNGEQSCRQAIAFLETWLRMSNPHVDVEFSRQVEAGDNDGHTLVVYITDTVGNDVEAAFKNAVNDASEVRIIDGRIQRSHSNGAAVTVIPRSFGRIGTLSEVWVDKIHRSSHTTEQTAWLLAESIYHELAHNILEGSLNRRILNAFLVEHADELTGNATGRQGMHAIGGFLGPLGLSILDNPDATGQPTQLNIGLMREALEAGFSKQFVFAQATTTQVPQQ